MQIKYFSRYLTVVESGRNIKQYLFKIPTCCNLYIQIHISYSFYKFLLKLSFLLGTLSIFMEQEDYMRILWKLCTDKITKMKQKSSSNHANCQPWLKKKFKKRKPNYELLSNKYSQTKANAHEALVWIQWNFQKTHYQ